MALSASNNYKGALSSPLQEEWLFEFRNQNYPAPDDPQPADTSDKIIRLSTADIPHASISDMKYHGFILNSPAIRESIDLSSSKSRVSNISISCANSTLSNHSALLSAEIYGGSRRYINREVLIYSRVGGYTQKIFTGRLKQVTLENADTVNLMIAVYDPIQDIDILQHQSKTGNFYPVFYGTGTPETSTVGTPDFVDTARVFPVQVDSLNNDVFNCLAHKVITDGRLHYPIKDSYDETKFPMFVPFDDIQNASDDSYEGASDDSNKNVLSTDLDLERSYKIRPQTVTDAGSITGLAVANAGNAYDATGAGTSATLTFSSDADSSFNATYVMKDLPKEEHNVSELKFHFTHQTSNFSDTNGDLAVIFRVLAYWNNPESDNPSFVDLTRTANASSTTTIHDLLNTTTFSTSLKTVPDQVRLLISFNNDPQDALNGTPNTATVAIKDMFFEYTAKIDQPTASDGTAEKLSKSSSVTSIKKLYTGADGLTKSWSTSTAITDILNMHRDLLYRFAGVTDTPIVSNGKSLSDLETDRANWLCKYYTNKQVSLKELLARVQFEGGFIHRFRPSDQASQYIYIDDAMTTLHTIRKEDMANMNISITPIDTSVTKREIKYEVNPINDKTFLTQTCTDTTNNPRSVYNISTKENVKTSELKVLRNKIGDANMGATTTIGGVAVPHRSNGFANYYNAIEGNPKLIINTDIINPGDSSASRNNGGSYFYLMEVGDICAFDHSNQLIAPFGESFDGKQFIVQSLMRGIGKLKVTLREI